MMRVKSIRLRFMRRKRIRFCWIVAGYSGESARRSRCSVELVVNYVQSRGVYPVYFVLVRSEDNLQFASFVFRSVDVVERSLSASGVFAFG